MFILNKCSFNKLFILGKTFQLVNTERKSALGANQMREKKTIGESHKKY